MKTLASGHTEAQADKGNEQEAFNLTRHVSRHGLTRASRHVGAAAIVLWSLFLIANLIVHSHISALFDYRGNFSQAARAILNGASPYQPGFLAHLVALAQRGKFSPEMSAFAVPVYPPPVLFAVAPFGLLPDAVGGTLFVVVSIAGFVWALRLLGVNDWRCHVVAVLSWPAVFGFWLGALSPLLLLGAATVWRLRANVLAPAIALAALVVAKLFPWPLGIWMVITRRWRALGAASAVAVIALMGCWAAIGFAGMTAYPHMLAELSSLEDRFGASLVAQLLALGLPLRVATAGGMAAGAALLIAAWRLARRDDDEARAFGLAVVAALVASPLVWSHYFVLLFVPVALMAPRLSPLWFVPMFCFLAPEPYSGYPWVLCPYLAAVLIVTCRLLAPSGARTGTALARARRRRRLGGLREVGAPSASAGRAGG